MPFESASSKGERSGRNDYDQNLLQSISIKQERAAPEQHGATHAL
jgi:hypothetical protein